MENIIEVHPETKEQEMELRSYLKKSKIKFTMKKSSPYDPKFVAKIRQSEEDYKNGRFVSVEAEDLSKFLGLE